MSTSAIIAKPTTGDGWQGVYHHSDGYPRGLGACLAGLLDGAFGGDLDAMTTYLIDHEPCGWSLIIGCDFSQPKGWTEERLGLKRPMPPQSYSARGDEPEGYLRSGDEANVDYLYVLLPDGVACYRGRRFVGLIPWGRPDFAETLERQEALRQ